MEPLIRFFNNLETNTEWQAFIEEHKNQWIRMVLEEWEGKLIDGDTLDWKRPHGHRYGSL